ncbi:MAG: F0F1 ATP synthase subunit B [Candidatus Pacebacteria bacterium]|nr:F0F1 ATP synthase subunit B [Candidatus Paceibacterota bacterium]
MESIVTKFHIDWKIIIAQAVNFGIVFVVLYIYALKPLNKLMDERAEKIGKGVSDAKANAQILEKTNKEYEEALQKARKEANDIFQSGKKDAEAKKTQMMETAKEEVAMMIENGKKTLEAEKVKMVNDAKKEVATLVLQATEKILGEKIDGSYEGRVTKELNNL